MSLMCGFAIIVCAVIHTELQKAGIHKASERNIALT